MYIYQHDRFIAACGPVTRYNEATAEQTEADREAYTEQAKYVSQFDAMMKKGKIKKVGIMRKDEVREIAGMEAVAVETVSVMADDDYSEYMTNPERFGEEGIAKI